MVGLLIEGRCLRQPWENMPDKFLGFAWKASPAEFRTSEMPSLQILGEKKRKNKDVLTML